MTNDHSLALSNCLQSVLFWKSLCEGRKRESAREAENANKAEFLNRQASLVHLSHLHVAFTLLHGVHPRAGHRSKPLSTLIWEICFGSVGDSLPLGHTVTLNCSYVSHSYQVQLVCVCVCVNKTLIDLSLQRSRLESYAWNVEAL